MHSQFKVKCMHDTFEADFLLNNIAASRHQIRSLSDALPLAYLSSSLRTNQSRELEESEVLQHWQSFLIITDQPEMNTVFTKMLMSPNSQK